MDVHIEEYPEGFVASKPSVGAISGLAADEILAFQIIYHHRSDGQSALDACTRYYGRVGHGSDEARDKASNLFRRLEYDGWFRKQRPSVAAMPLASVYFTVTRYCDLACPYCYQGLNNRNNTELSINHARTILSRIAEVNPDAFLIISGGEPLAHSSASNMLSLVDSFGFRFELLTNGTFLNPSAIAVLKSLTNLWAVQLSIDGAREETHAITRGHRHFDRVISALNQLSTANLPFLLAPTLHDRNIDDLFDISVLAIDHGGWIKPNLLREIPGQGLDFSRVRLTYQTVYEKLQTVHRRLLQRFGAEKIEALQARYQSPATCSVNAHNSRFSCGVGFSVVDVDWNGDVYPCNFTKDKKLILGNAIREDFRIILARSREKGVRIMSSEISKCSSCKFTSRCAGGCRAAAWYAYGTMRREDDLCSANYDAQLKRVLAEITPQS